MRSWSIRWLLLGVSAAVVVMPALALLLLRSYTSYLVRRTEEQLLAQGVLIGEAYREAWLRESGLALPPRARVAYAPIHLQADRLREHSPPEPKALPAAELEEPPGPSRRAGRSLEAWLRRSQSHNLSAVRVLDARGCVVATTRSDAERCLSELPEVREARQGRYAAVLRARVSDEPPPALSSISRRGDQRVFVALPVLHEGRAIGIVRLSRTAESGLEWIWKNRLPLFGGVAFVLALALSLSLISARFIARPLERMAAVASSVSASGVPWPEGVVGHAPRELVALGAALETMTQKLAAKTSYVREFAANVSHELKTPLTSIQGAAELLREQWHGMQEAERERFLANIQADAERTNVLVRRLLELARIEAAPPALAGEAVRLFELERALALRYPEGVDIRVEEPTFTLTIHPEQLHAAIGNLIDNALRYRRDRPVSVRLRPVAGRLEVLVSDDGPGVSAANLPRVFDRFFTTERDRGGTGLGLAIVRAVAESRGGSVTCESSAPGVATPNDKAGTTFRLLL